MKYRLGVRIPVIPNAGIRVITLTAHQAQQIAEAIDVIRMVLTFSGHPEYANWLVFEARN